MNPELIQALTVIGNFIDRIMIILTFLMVESLWLNRNK